MGIVGVVINISCYARVQWQREYAKAVSYSALNLLGSTFLVISLFHTWNLVSFIGNSTWGCISLYGLYRCLKYMRHHQEIPAPQPEFTP